MTNLVYLPLISLKSIIQRKKKTVKIKNSKTKSLQPKE